MDVPRIPYDNKLWGLSPTLSDKNSFFHSAFGTRLKQDEPYTDKQARFRRMRWATFLTYFENETMPRVLADILRKCWAVNDDYKQASVDDNHHLQNYVSDIVTAKHGVTIEEIPILATLENVKITVLANDGQDPVIVAYPDKEILGDFVNTEKRKEEVLVYLELDVFSKLNVVLQYIEKAVQLCTKDLYLQPSTTRVFKYEKNGSAGSKGVEYQIGILTVFLLNSLRCLNDWNLSTENKAAGKFDDVVLEWPNGVILLQAKHKENKKKITFEELISVNSKNDDFSLPKYFLSYQNIKTRFNIKNVVICTNAIITGDAAKFVTSHVVNSDNMLYNGQDDCTFYKFSNEILPYLKVNTENYYRTNFLKTSINETAITDKNLKEFLEHLQLYCGYPQRSDIGNATKELLALLRRDTNLVDQISTLEVTAKVTKWFQEKNGVYLTETYSKALFCEIYRDKHWQKLEGYNVYFQKRDFKIDDTSRILLVNVDDGCLLQEIRICQSLKHEKLNILYIRCDDDLELQKHVMDAFKLPQYTFLIIVCLKISVEFNVVKYILDKYQYKKIVIVSHSNMLQHLCLENSHCSVLYDSVSLKDLSKETQEMILTKKNIIFQGKDVSFKDLLARKDYEAVLKPGIIEKLLRNEKIRVGVRLQDLDTHVSLFYINRKFQRKIRRNRDEKELQIVTEKSIFSIKEKVILIADRAGMGKTTVLTRLAVTIKKRYPNLWIVMVELNDYTAFFKQAVSEKRSTVFVKDLLNSKQTSRLQNDLEDYVFSLHRKVVLLLDGVDEISPDYTEPVTRLLFQCRQDSNFLKVFVSTRPHVASELESKLETKSFVLLPFTVPDQVAFLSNYWMYNLKINSTSKNKYEQYAKALITKMHVWINHNKQSENHFAAIPLQIRMLAEIFQQNYTIEGLQWEGCKEYIIGDEDEVKLPEKMDITNLYEMFIEKKRNIFIEKSNPTGNTIADRALSDQFEECLDYHRSLALEIILDKTKCELFSTYRRIGNKLEPYMVKIGIVQKIQDEFHFVHRTFAEYFVAEGLMKELQLPNQDVEFQRCFIDEILLQSQFKVIRAFLDSFLQVVVHKLPHDVFKNYQSLTDDIDLSHRRKFSLIHRLSEEGCVATLQLLFKCIGFKTVKDKCIRISDLYRRDRHGNIPLQSLGNTLDILNHLVQRGGVNIVEDKVTPLHLASAYGHLEMVKFLVTAGADIESRDFFHQTPLHLAVNYDYLEVAKFLAEQGADIKYRDVCDRYAILIEVINKGQTSIAAYILDKIIERGDYDVKDTVVAYVASYLGKTNILGLLLEQGLDVNCTIDNGQTLLFGSVRGKQQDTMEYLVSQGADVNTADKKGNTVLHFVTHRGQLSFVRLLVKCGSNVDIKNKEGFTPLHLATLRGYLGIVKFLLEDNDGRSALHLAAEKGKMSIVKYFVDAGVDVNFVDNNGWTALHFATSQGKVNTVKQLVSLGAEIRRDCSGRTPLHTAAIRGRLEILRFFVEICDTDTNVVDGTSRTALQLAVQNERLDIVKYLVRCAVNVNHRDEEGCTALHIAASKGFLCIVEVLVKFGADVNVRNNLGHVAIDLAKVGDHLDTVECLVKC